MERQGMKAKSPMISGGAIAAMALCITVASAQEPSIAIVESSVRPPVARVVNNSQRRFDGSRSPSAWEWPKDGFTCPEGRRPPATIREGLGSNVQRILIHSYDKSQWRDWSSVTEYLRRVLDAPPENGQLYPFQIFSQTFGITISGSAEIGDGSLRPIEFAAGYAHLAGENGCEWWARLPPYTQQIQSPGYLPQPHTLPDAIQSGTASMQEARRWVNEGALNAIPGLLLEDLPFASVEQDIDLDGKSDLLLETVGGGSGGRAYAAFLNTGIGYRYVGGFQGRIQPVSRAAGAPPRMVIATGNGSGRSIVQLVELRSAGLYRLAQKGIETRDSSTGEENVPFAAVFSGSAASESAVSEIFGSAY